MCCFAGYVLYFEIAAAAQEAAETADRGLVPPVTPFPSGSSSRNLTQHSQGLTLVRVCVWLCAHLRIPVMPPTTSPCSPQSRQRFDPSTQRCPSPPLPALISGRHSSQVISMVYSHWLVFCIVLPFLECTLSGIRQQVTF